MERKVVAAQEEFLMHLGMAIHTAAAVDMDQLARLWETGPQLLNIATVFQLLRAAEVEAAVRDQCAWATNTEALDPMEVSTLMNVAIVAN